MLDLCLRNARRPGSTSTTTIAIADGRIATADGPARETLDVYYEVAANGARIAAPARQIARI